MQKLRYIGIDCSYVNGGLPQPAHIPQLKTGGGKERPERPVSIRTGILVTEDLTAASWGLGRGFTQRRKPPTGIANRHC